MHYLYFAGTVLTINLAPGPAMLYVLKSSVDNGVKAGASAALGVESGVLFYVIATSLGLGYLLSQYPSAYRLLQLAGAAYLLYLAYKAWPRKAPQNQVQQGAAREENYFLKGIFVNLTNPKIGLFFVSLMPQLLPAGAPPSQFLIYGLCFNLGGLLVNGSVALFSSSAKRIIRRIAWFDYLPPLLFVLIVAITVQQLTR
jgi:threonine/homoserine/homoserine lactone efflux protein